ncbi:MAG: hypothetical protein ACRYG6_01705, partial [Janthinobacterium lividum]
MTMDELLRQRPALGAALAPHLARAGGEAAWEAALLGLVRANAGAACVVAAAGLDARLPGVGLREVAGLVEDAAEVCRRAGAGAALAGLEALPGVFAVLRDAGALGGWSRAVLGLAGVAPDCVGVVVGRAGALLRPAGVAGAEAFLATGVRAAGRDAARRRRFLAGESEEGRRALERLGGAEGFEAVAGWVRPYLAALGGRGVAVVGVAEARRVRLGDGGVGMPEVFAGVPAGMAGALFQAAAAHAAAHLAFGGARFAAGTLKPLQVVLVTLVEDARVEALLMRRFPGLRALWAPWHVAAAGGVPTVPGLLARVARGLFDPGWEDGDGLVARARGMVAGADPMDPGASRRIGGLLGNDLGQQRLQFDARGHVVEPAYRDDGVGLWRFDAAAGADPEVAEMLSDARPAGDGAERDGNATEGDAPDGGREARGAVVERAASGRGAVLARYPEWDAAAGVERAGWATVRDATSGGAGVRDAGARVEAMLGAAPLVRGRVARLLRAVAVGGRERLRRQEDGDALDLAAAVEAAVDLRRGVVPDGRVHARVARRRGDLAVGLLLDASESTRAVVAGGRGSVLDAQVQAAAVLAEALAGAGVAGAVQAFASCGREDVRVAQVQAMGGAWDAAARARLGAVVPGLSTRLGTALRHAGAGLRVRGEHRRVLLVLTDGVPSDVDTDAAELMEDAR